MPDYSKEINFATKLRDIEGHLKLLKERLLLLDRTFLKEIERFNSEFSMIKESMALVKDEIERIKEGLGHIIHESAEFVRKEELEGVEHFVKEDALKRIINEALKKKKLSKR